MRSTRGLMPLFSLLLIQSALPAAGCKSEGQKEDPNLPIMVYYALPG